MLYDRGRELGEIDRLLDGARSGAGGVLLLAGEAGIGKTALLEAARSRADGLQVIGAVGIEAEANLPFAALAEVAGGLLDGLSALPGPQARAIEAALALTPGRRSGGDRFAVCAGFLGLVRGAAARQPLLLLVDDSQWLDSASAECLGYAARRLAGSPVALLLTARVEPLPPALHGLPELALRALEPAGARELLRAAAPDLARTAADSVVAAAAGNPLALLELPSLLSEEQRRGIAPVDAVPAPRNGLRDALERRLARLDPAARSAVVVAAASLDGEPGPVLRACRALGVADVALEGAEAAGVLRLAPERIAFAHPLLRAVVTEATTPVELRRVHRALAEHASDDARAWHLAAAAIAPDDAVAAALAAAGQRAATRGAHTAAADALERAARLSTDDAGRAARLFAAGLQAALGGAYERGVAILEPAAELADPAMRTGVRHLQAMMSLNGGTRSALTNQRVLAEEAEHTASRDPDARGVLLADAAVNAVVAADCRLAYTCASAAAASLGAHALPANRCHVAAVHGMALALRGRVGEAAPALDEAGELIGAVEPLSPAAQSISFALHMRISCGRPDVLRREMLAITGAARETGTLGLLPYYLLVAADAAYRLGDWPAAAREAAEAIAIADECGQLGPLSLALVVSARVRGSLGEEAAARDELARAVAVASPRGYDAAVLWARAALGFLALGAGRTADAIAELEATRAMAERAGLEEPLIVPWAIDLVEACARAGDLATAGEVAALLARQASQTRVPAALALAARAEGLVAAADAFDSVFARALELHGPAPRPAAVSSASAAAPFERARTLLAWGGRLHRARRRADARERLRAALEVFESLGAKPWAELAAAELAAAGARRRRVGDRDDSLTPQELRVTRAAAAGATTREIAADLFLSPKTVEFHLGSVYRKLGVRSRAALAARVAELPLSDAAGCEPVALVS